MIDSRRMRYAGHLWRYPTERYARQSMFAAWNLTRAGNGKRSTPANSWEAQVHLDLWLPGDLWLDMPKEVYREKLEELYSNQDLCDETVGIVIGI